MLVKYNMENCVIIVNLGVIELLVVFLSLEDGKM